MEQPIDSFKGWRIGLPPQFYPTHSNAYYTGVGGGSFTEVSCIGMPSTVDHLKSGNNVYKNSFGTEVALFRTSEGGSARMAVSWDTPGLGGEMGRVRGQRGSVYAGKYEGLEKNLPDIRRPPLPHIPHAIPPLTRPQLCHPERSRDSRGEIRIRRNFLRVNRKLTRISRGQILINRTQILLNR